MPVRTLRRATGFLAGGLTGSCLLGGCGPPPTLRARLPVALGRLGGTQAALQVVEDEADGRLGRRGGGEHELASSEDENAALRGRCLELHERPLIGTGLIGGGEQGASALRELLRPGVV